MERCCCAACQRASRQVESTGIRGAGSGARYARSGSGTQFGYCTNCTPIPRCIGAITQSGHGNDAAIATIDQLDPFPSCFPFRQTYCQQKIAVGLDVNLRLPDGLPVTRSEGLRFSDAVTGMVCTADANFPNPTPSCCRVGCHKRLHTLR